MRQLKVAEDARCDIDAVFLHGVREYGLSNADAYVTGSGTYLPLWLSILSP